MRSIRCDACGMKALLAASQCPHCGHLFEVRDSFGELMPLAHCPTCDSDYPLSRGECRWCGTKPEGFRIAPYAWKGAGIVAFIGLGFGAWLANRSTAREPSASQQLAESKPPAHAETQAPAAQSDSVAIKMDSIVVPPTFVQADSVNASSHDTPSAVVTAAAIPVEVADRGVPAASPSVVDTAPVKAAKAVEQRVRSPQPVPPRSRRARWVGGVARAWIPVRASANTKSRVVASIGPDTRVQLGEVRGTWVRLRMRGLSGWVERRHFISRSESAR